MRGHATAVMAAMLLLALSACSFASKATPTRPQAPAPVGEYDLTKPIVEDPEWWYGVVDVVNFRKPVYAWSLEHMDHFYYSGDTDAFSTFLEQYSKLKGPPLTLAIHIGPAMTGNFEYGKPKTIPFDWDLLIRPNMIPDGPVIEDTPLKCVVTVELWLGGKVELSKIAVPKNVKVVDGGDIGKFIAAHEKAAKEGKP